MRWGLVVAALMTASPALAQNPNAEPMRVTRLVDSVAFDPALFFDPWSVIVRIRYRGDDWGWPVYSIAVRSGCESADQPRPACYQHRVARMLRAPVGPKGSERPRWRGIDMMAPILGSHARTEAAIKAKLDKAGLEWLEADLLACPGAMAMLAQAEGARWGPYTPPPDPEGAINITLHADTVAVDFKAPDGWASWNGVARTGTPAHWAMDFAAVLEPCWRPAAAPKPWRRVPATD